MTVAICQSRMRAQLDVGASNFSETRTSSYQKEMSFEKLLHTRISVARSAHNPLRSFLLAIPVLQLVYADFHTVIFHNNAIQ
jgi:hypothetical protein